MKNNHEYITSYRNNARHGHIFSPPSRATIAYQEGLIDEGKLNQCEAGKFFPLAIQGVQDLAYPTDIVNMLPPQDGKIASANQPDSGLLDLPGLNQWKKHAVTAGSMLSISWKLTARHSTRRWNYFITKIDWNPNKVLSRAQFEATPFVKIECPLEPFWEHQLAMQPNDPTVHEITLPAREGYHVLLAVWEVADTGNAFYQVIDLDFTSDGGGSQRPSAPTNFQATAVTENSIAFSWRPSTGVHQITTYRINRNGVAIADVKAPVLNWTDMSVQADSTCNYSILAIDSMGNLSVPSATIQITTPPAGGVEGPPGAPQNLHSMEVTSNSIDLMWGKSNSANPLKQYHIYRDGLQVATTSADIICYLDSGLSPDSFYRYFVAAEDIHGRLSVPSNILRQRTESAGGGEIPEWALGVKYSVNDLVRYNNKTYQCLQAHVSNEGWDPESTNRVLWMMQ